LNLSLAFILGMAVSWVYKKTHKGLSYSQSFMLTTVFVSDTYADMNDLVAEFGYKPEMNVKHGVANFVAWYKQYHSL